MLRYTLGNAFYNEKKYTDAIEHLQKAVELKPDYSAAWKMLGRSLAAAESHQRALDAFNQGFEVAEANGDKQTAKEIAVFRKRVIKSLEQG